MRLLIYVLTVGLLMAFLPPLRAQSATARMMLRRYPRMCGDALGHVPHPQAWRPKP